MTDILDNANVLKQRDPENALGIIADQYKQLTFKPKIECPEHDGREITAVVVTGMGGSALAALLVKVLLAKELPVSFEIVRGYSLPAYVGKHTLVIASSYSGNTEETLNALAEAQARGAQVAILASGGKLIAEASTLCAAHAILPGGVQPRMAMLYSLKALFALLENFNIVNSKWQRELESLAHWVREESSSWLPSVSTNDNYAKQLALQAAGKSPVFYGTPLTAPLAYKWKISWNETAKNVAFWNEYPEFNHNEFMGWASHPVEKPFGIFDLTTSFDTARIAQRMELSDRLLSGKRPHATTVALKGETLLAQMVWGAILADFSSAYAAILNGVDPTPVVLIEKLKQELAANPQPQ